LLTNIADFRLSNSDEASATDSAAEPQKTEQTKRSLKTSTKAKLNIVASKKVHTIVFRPDKYDDYAYVNRSTFRLIGFFLKKTKNFEIDLVAFPCCIRFL
jgi:hypothetical protein